MSMFLQSIKKTFEVCEYKHTKKLFVVTFCFGPSPRIRIYSTRGQPESKTIAQTVRARHWIRVVSRAELFGSGSELSLSKCFGPISGLHTKLFYNIQSNDFIFRDVHLFCSSRWLPWVKWLWFFFGQFHLQTHSLSPGFSSRGGKNQKGGSHF